MACCEPTCFNKDEINGECPDCGAQTVDGEAYERCSYSPCACVSCGHSPCDESC